MVCCINIFGYFCVPSASSQQCPHIAQSQETIDALIQETEEKVADGYEKVVRWGEIKNNIPKRLKISPVAMVPYESQKFRTILDLSFKLQYKGLSLPFVNDTTIRQAPAEAMVQLGQAFYRLITAMVDAYDTSHPFVFSKIDLKDRFWQMSNFCYVLPSQTAETNWITP